MPRALNVLPLLLAASLTWLHPSLLAAADDAAELQYRAWTDATGTYSTEAAFLKFEDGKVHLQKKEGGVIVLPAGRLSRADQQFVRELLAGKRSGDAPTAASRPAASGGGAGENDWRWWRGPQFNGVAAEGQSPPTTWSDAENVVWKTPVPGRGHSSPVVVGSRVLLTTCDESSETQSVLCFDRSTGEEKWKREVNRGGLPRVHNKNTHASPTVACDGERIYASFAHHDAVHVVALTLEGQPVWQKTIGPFQPQQYKYGYAPSPLLYESLVIVAVDYDQGGYLTALKQADGEPAWRAPRPKRTSYSSPVVAHVGGRDQLLISGGELVASYDPQNGRPLWSVNATTSATCGTMVWDGDLVFASGGYPQAGTFAIRADGSGSIVWQNREKCYEQSMLAHDGYLYAVNDTGIAYCWKADDGTEMWKTRLGGPVSASPVLADGNIYIPNERGTMFVFRAIPRQYEAVSQNQLGDEAFATPAFCGGQVFARVADSSGGRRQEMLYCLGRQNAE
ncbi:MAG: PQQ-binding-like beta-propeller repeat protein [Pirellulaceae bacterium]